MQKLKIEQHRNNSNKLYRNNGDGSYTEVHKEAGIDNHGYGLSGTVGDLNGDGFLDIYVANDYAMYDFIYMNNGDGTFKDASLTAINKGSINAMGSDINDFNNDGFPDIMVTDMDMEENYTYKTFMLSSQVEVMRILQNSGYGYQNRSNSLQLNNGDGTFSEISRTAGVATTDWSWSNFFADFDNDGYKDLFIANGFVRDFNVDESESYHELRRAIRINDSSIYYKIKKKLPTYALSHPNFIFHNNGDLTFTDCRDDWGIYYPTVSYGAGYADLDLDGDLDIVCANVNLSPFIYRNNSESLNAHNNWVEFRFKGYEKNSGGLGTKVNIYYGDKMQSIQHTNVRGYITSMENDCHFGLGNVSRIDYAEITWLDGRKQIIRDISTNKVVTLDHAEADAKTVFASHIQFARYFEADTVSGIDFTHAENNFDDYTREFLLPHRMSMLGPGIATGDINGDGLDDCYIGGAMGQSGAIYIQTNNGKFRRSSFSETNSGKKLQEDAGALFVDVDGDSDNDLYIATGGNEHPAGDPLYTGRLFLNDGDGNFTKAQDALPASEVPSSGVIAADFDKDGDADLFVCGRQIPGKYLEPASCFIYRNDKGKFTDITKEIAPVLQNVGMVTSAIWTDFNNDGALDIVLAGDWMKVMFLQSIDGKFTDVTESTGLENTEGWWQSITGADLDNDGDVDYIAGNFGTNRRYKNTISKGGVELPLEGYLYDFDKNGTQDFIMAYYQHDNLYPVKTRERMLEEIPALAQKFPDWDSYGKSTMSDIFEKDLNYAIHRSAYLFHSVVFMNEGNGKFSMKTLPNEEQVSPMFGTITDDFNNDGFLDIITHGNFYNTEIEITRHDASTGMLLLGKGNGEFTPVKSIWSGFWSRGDAKALSVLLTGPEHRPLYIGSENNSAAIVYQEIANQNIFIPLKQQDAYAMLQLRDGKQRRQELYSGNSYLSQSSKFIRVTPAVVKVTVVDYAGNERIVYPLELASQ